jgi:hypothetical protein
LSNREGVAVRVFEVGDLGVTLERGDALLVGLQPQFVLLLEGDAPLGELVDNPLDVIDAPASQGRCGLASVLRGEVDVQHAILCAAVLHVVG